MNGKESENTNFTITRKKETDENKETLSGYDNKGEEKTSSTSKNKEKAHAGYVQMYKYGKHLFNSMYKRACASQETTISKMEKTVDIYSYEIK